MGACARLGSRWARLPHAGLAGERALCAFLLCKSCFIRDIDLCGPMAALLALHASCAISWAHVCVWGAAGGRHRRGLYPCRSPRLRIVPVRLTCLRQRVRMAKPQTIADSKSGCLGFALHDSLRFETLPPLLVIKAIPRQCQASAGQASSNRPCRRNAPKEHPLNAFYDSAKGPLIIYGTGSDGQGPQGFLSVFWICLICLIFLLTWRELPWVSWSVRRGRGQMHAPGCNSSRR